MKQSPALRTLCFLSTWREGDDGDLQSRSKRSGAAGLNRHPRYPLGKADEGITGAGSDHRSFEDAEACGARGSAHSPRMVSWYGEIWTTTRGILYFAQPVVIPGKLSFAAGASSQLPKAKLQLLLHLVPFRESETIHALTSEPVAAALATIKFDRRLRLVGSASTLRLGRAFPAACGFSHGCGVHPAESLVKGFLRPVRQFVDEIGACIARRSRAYCSQSVPRDRTWRVGRSSVSEHALVQAS
jgi:hypothetical protein